MIKTHASKKEKQPNKKSSLAKQQPKSKDAKFSGKSPLQKKVNNNDVSGRKRANVSIPKPDEVKVALDTLLSNEHAIEYLRKNVSKMAVDVIGMLVTPKTDEYLAEELGTKINAIRRILNIMQGYGITNYYISKNTKGWLSFAWYINTSKLPPFLEYVEGMEREKSIVNDTCNDYFVCEECYKSDRFVFTFDSAFENSFKCNNCGNNLNRMDRIEAELLVNNSRKNQMQPTNVRPA
ncbi:MAG: hypothetical protein KGI06_00395 [Candidatus Micrarchaeota archaeon]|nr:hypothetical protein [Candidatus Micrarchaeota archaeon]